MAQNMEFKTVTPEEAKQRRKRSIAIALMLGGLSLLFFITTMVRLGNNVTGAH